MGALDRYFLFFPKSIPEFKKCFLVILKELVGDLLYAEGVLPSPPNIPVVFFLS